MRLRQLRPMPRFLALLGMVCNLAFTSAQSQPSFSELKAKAESGDAQAQVKVGLAYASGNGVPVDDSDAVRWFHKAAEQGDATGEYSLGEMYAMGRGVKKDYKQAAQWIQKAADQGEIRAVSNLGAMYLNGLGVKKNEKKAFQLTQQAADKGLAAAQFGLGEMYASGRGVKQNLPKAVDWYTKAADQNDAPALNNLAWLLAIAGDMTIRNTSKAVDLALRAVNATQEKVPEYLDTLATAYFANGHPDKALKAEQKALALRPDDKTYQQSLRNYEEIAEAAKNLPASLSSGELAHAGPGVTPPKAVYTPDPGPPAKKGSAKVVLWVIVGADGKVHDLRVVRSANPDLDHKALDTVRRWTFQPARKNGQAVAVQISVEVSFRLD